MIDQFQIANLTGQIDTSTHDWGLTPSGRALGLDLGSVRNLQKADRIRQAFFKPGDVRPNVRFLLEPLGFNGAPSAVTLSVDGVPASFESSARKSVELHWPGPTPGVTLTFQGKAGTAPTVRTWTGDFAFLQMLQGAQRSAASSSGVTFQLSQGSYTATFRLRLSETPSNPFLLPELKTFSCPAKL